MARTRIRPDSRRKKGSGSVYRRSDSKGWIAQVTYYDEFAGKWKKTRRNAPSEDKARKVLAVMQSESVTPSLPDSGTVSQYLEAWAKVQLPLAGLAPKTVDQYEFSIATYAVPTLGEVKLADFTPSKAEQWLSRLADVDLHSGKGKISVSTQRGTFNAVTRALNTAVRDKIITTNPLKSVPRPKGRGKPVPASGGDHVDRALVAAKGRPIEPLLTLVAFTGMRVGEALAITWDDVDLDASRVTVRRSGVDRDRTKTGRDRTLTLLPVVVTQLRALRKKQAQDRLLMGSHWQNSDGLVFVTGTGRPLDYANARSELARVLKKAGLPTARPFHSLRHGLATRLLEAGLPMPVVSQILGHANIQTTVNVYGHLDPAIPADVLAEALGQS